MNIYNRSDEMFNFRINFPVNLGILNNLKLNYTRIIVDVEISQEFCR